MAKLSALKGAVRKTAGAAAKPKANIIVASDVLDPETQNVVFTANQVVEAIDGYAEGHKLEEQGKALKEMHRPTLVQTAQRGFSKQWVAEGTQPENPKITTNAQGTGTFVGAAFVDREMKLDENQFNEIVAVIGEEKAEANIVRRDEISFNPEKLNTVLVPAKLDPKTQEEIEPAQTVLDLVDEAISAALQKAGREDVLEGLFVVKEVFQTKKGLLPKALGLVGGPGPGAQVKLYDLLNAARVITTLKPGGAGAKEDND